MSTSLRSLYPSEYNIWGGMKSRCRNVNALHYSDYGGRGITVCDRWAGPLGFKNFLFDMGPKPQQDLTLDRKNNNGNYEPSNCHWATRVAQANNKRRREFEEDRPARIFAKLIRGKRVEGSLSQFELAKKLNVSYALVQKAESGANLSPKFKDIFERWLQK